MVTVIDRNNVILARHPDPENLTGKSMPEASIIKTVLAGGEGTTEAVGLDGVRRLYAFTSLRGVSAREKVYVWAGIPKSVVFAEADRIFTVNIAGLGFVAILTLALAWTGSDTFVLRQVHALISATKKISRGEFGARTGESYDEGEFGQLSRSFDGMAESLEKRYQQVKALHEIDLAISSNLELRAVLEVLLEKIDRFLPYSVTTVRLLNKDTGELESFACRNLDEKEWKQATARSRGGLSSMLPQDNSPVIVRNAQTDPRSLASEFIRKHGLVSFLRVPLTAKNEILGVLTFFTKEEHDFTAEEVEFLTALAGQAAIAIHNARLYEETERRKREAEELARVAKSLTETLEITAVGERIATSARELFSVKGATLRLLQADGSFRHLASAGQVFSRSSAGNEIPPDVGVTSRAVAEGRPIWSADVLNDPEIRIGDEMRDYQSRTGDRSMMAAPLRAHENLIGALTLTDQSGRNYFADEIALLKTFADQAALALENALLYEQTERHLKRIEALREIDKAITSTLELRAVLDLLLEKIEVFLPFPAATTIRLFNRKTEKFENTACRNVDERMWKAQVGRGTGNISREILKTKAPVMVHDIQTDLQRKAGEFYRNHGFVSYLAVPLVAKDDVLGILSFYTKTAHEFTQQETDFLLTLAGQAAIAIHNSQLYEEIGLSKKELEQTSQYLDRSLKQLGSFYTALTPIDAAASTEEMMGGIIDRLLDATGADAALIRLRDENENRYPIVSQRNLPEDYQQRVEAKSSGHAVTWVITNGQPIIVRDIATDSRLAGKLQLQLGFQSCAMLPLKVHNEVRGVMHIASRTLGYFDEEQAPHLLAIARQMGIALENRQLYYDLKSSRDELERANKGKDEFLGVISHELRTPLNVIKGYTEVLKDEVLGDITPEQAMALGKIMHQSNELLSMINSVLQVARIEAEAVKAERREVNLGNFINELRINYDFPMERNLTLHWNYPSDLPVVKTDDEKLKHVLQNLVNNAIKFTERGTVTISARYDSAAGIVEFKITDTGIGIPRDKIPGIFDMFRQVDSSETRSYGGAGIGLYIVKKFTELLGGKIEVQSEPGKGSAFVVSLPVHVEIEVTRARDSYSARNSTPLL